MVFHVTYFNDGRSCVLYALLIQLSSSAVIYLYLRELKAFANKDKYSTLYDAYMTYMYSKLIYIHIQWCMVYIYHISMMNIGTWQNFKCNLWVIVNMGAANNKEELCF